MLFVNGLLDKGVSNRGIASAIADVGGTLDPDVVGRHKNNHWKKPERTEGPQPTKGDLAIMVRDKVADLIEDMDPDTMMVFGKDVGPLLGKGLAAQAILDKREVNDKKLGIAAGALSIQAWLAGLGRVEQPPELDDGMTFEGEAVEVLHTPGEDGLRSEE